MGTKSEMSSRERVLSALRKEPVDYVPCCGHFNPLNPTLRRGHTWNFPWSDGASLEEQLAVQVDQLGLDVPILASFELTQPEPGVRAEIWMEGDVLHKRYTTPAGELHASVRFNDLWPHGQDIPFYSDFAVGHYVEPWIENRNDLACLQHILAPLPAEEAFRRNEERWGSSLALARARDLPTVANVGMGLTNAQQLFGVEGICLAVVEQPELVEDFLAFEGRRNLLGIETAAALGFDIVRRNGFYETADFYSPTTLESLLKNRFSAEAQAIHRHGMLADYTVHTGVMPILDYLAGLPFDSLFGIDIAFKGVDLVRIRDTLSPSKTLWTGPSSTYHLWKGPDATRRAVREVFDIFGKKGLILTPCVSAHSIMPWESTLAMIEEWEKCR